MSGTVVKDKRHTTIHLRDRIHAQHVPQTTPGATSPKESPKIKAARYVSAVTRISIGTVFMWAFLDKLFGWGHATASANSWLNGGSPTAGFLKHGSSGPFKGFYNFIGGTPVVDWLFMLGLGSIGVALVGGIAMRFAAVAGGVLLVMMWSAVLPPANHIFMDDHLIYAMLLTLLALTGAGTTLGFGKSWAKLPIVRRLAILR